MNFQMLDKPTTKGVDSSNSRIQICMYCAYCRPPSEKGEWHCNAKGSETTVRSTCSSWSKVVA